MHIVKHLVSIFFFSHMVDHVTRGRLDVDVINPEKGKPAVENITWADKSEMVDGDYEFFRT